MTPRPPDWSFASRPLTDLNQQVGAVVKGWGEFLSSSSFLSGLTLWTIEEIQPHRSNHRCRRRPVDKVWVDGGSTEGNSVSPLLKRRMLGAKAFIRNKFFTELMLEWPAVALFVYVRLGVRGNF